MLTRLPEVEPRSQCGEEATPALVPMALLVHRDNQLLRQPPHPFLALSVAALVTMTGQLDSPPSPCHPWTPVRQALW